MLRLDACKDANKDQTSRFTKSHLSTDSGRYDLWLELDARFCPQKSCSNMISFSVDSAEMTSRLLYT